MPKPHYISLHHDSYLRAFVSSSKQGSKLGATRAVPSFAGKEEKKKDDTPGETLVLSLA